MLDPTFVSMVEALIVEHKAQGGNVVLDVRRRAALQMHFKKVLNSEKITSGYIEHLQQHNAYLIPLVPDYIRDARYDDAFMDEIVRCGIQKLENYDLLRFIFDRMFLLSHFHKKKCLMEIMWRNIFVVK